MTRTEAGVGKICTGFGVLAAPRGNPESGRFLHQSSIPCCVQANKSESMIDQPDKSGRRGLFPWRPAVAGAVVA